ncbi:hypothetical protein U1Q18_024739, partial [Sarracenia purpurea var. burkii]
YWAKPNITKASPPTKTRAQAQDRSVSGAWGSVIHPGQANSTDRAFGLARQPRTKACAQDRSDLPTLRMARDKPRVPCRSDQSARTPMDT